MYQIKYLDEVLNDIKEAKEWYKKQQEGLEERFANEIKLTILKVIKMPTAYSIRYRNTRIAHTKIFPFNIHFYIDEEAKMIVFIGIVSLMSDKN